MKLFFPYQGQKSGQSLVELLVVIALAALFLPTLITGLFATRNGRSEQQQRLQAVSFLKEAQDGVRAVRDRSWTALAQDGTFHLIASSSAWALSPGSEVLNGFGFTRSIVIDDVYRDTSGAIATSGGSLDPSTKKVTITVSWTSPHAGSVTSTSYLSHFVNQTHTDTTVADFSPGIQNNATITNTQGGEITLNKVPQAADWCKPQNSIENTLTLPRQANAISAVVGNVYLGTGDGTNGINFINVGISDPPPPATPAASILGTYTNNYKTNAVFSDGTYAYLATDNTTNQVIILDISHTPYTQVGTIGVPSSAAANGIYVSNNIAFVTSSNKLYTVNVATKSGNHTTVIDSISMWIGLGPTPLAKQVVVVGNHAYVGTANTLFGLQNFSFNNSGDSLKLVGVSNLTWQQSAQGLYVNQTGTRAYIAFNQGGFFSKGFFIVDTSQSDPPAWWPFPNFYGIVGTYNTGSTDPTNMTVVPTNDRAIVVGNGGTYQYIVIDITNENNPVFCGGLSIGSGVSGVSSIKETDGDVYSYIITGETKDQFKIIAGGAGGGGQYNSSGTFESASFDATSSATFNALFATVKQPTNTTIKLQAASALAGSNGCTNATFTYLGPNGDPNAYYTPQISTPSAIATISASIPFGTYNPSYQNPGRCYRYKVFLSTSDTTQTPTLYDATVNYSQ